MYIAVGSQSNNNAGEDCRRAAILEFNPDGSGYRVYASGIRNPVGLAFQPGTDILWTASPRLRRTGDVRRVYYGVLAAFAVWGCIGLNLAPVLDPTLNADFASSFLPMAQRATSI